MPIKKRKSRPKPNPITSTETRIRKAFKQKFPQITNLTCHKQPKGFNVRGQMPVGETKFYIDINIDPNDLERDFDGLLSRYFQGLDLDIKRNS